MLNPSNNVAVLIASLHNTYLIFWLRFAASIIAMLDCILATKDFNLSRSWSSTSFWVRTKSS